MNLLSASALPERFFLAYDTDFIFALGHKRINEPIQIIETLERKIAKILDPQSVRSVMVSHYYERTIKVTLEVNRAIVSKRQDSASVIDQIDPLIIEAVMVNNVITDAAKLEKTITVTSMNIPAAPIDAENLTLTLQQPNSSLTGVYNAFSSCDNVNIYNPHFVERNVLDLLRFDGTVTFANFAQWVHIINKHLNGSRDILACQEELIEEGFESLASF